MVSANKYSSKGINYGSVTLEFVAASAKKLGLDLNSPDALKATLYAIGFALNLTDKDGKVFPARIDRVNNVNVRCIDRPYMCRKTSVFSGVLRDDFPNAQIYGKVDILDIGGVGSSDSVSDMAFVLPSVEKVNTRKYTKRDARSDVVVMDLAQVDDLNEVI